MIDIPCKCGHYKKDHTFTTDGKHLVCNVRRTGWVWMDTCTKYIPDNLTYIEALAKEKGLV